MAAEMRAAFYGLLAQAFLPPDRGWAALKKGAAHPLFRRVKKLYPSSALQNSLALFEEQLKTIAKGKDLEELSLEYNRLFVGPYRLVAPPYESVYRGGEEQVMAACAVQVEKLYREEGLEISSDFKDLPDHIVAELQFMGFLCLKEAQAANQGNEAEALKYIEKQNLFLREHLRQWIEEFSLRLTSGSKSPFYSSLGKLASLFVRLDKDIVSLLLKKIDKI